MTMIMIKNKIADLEANLVLLKKLVKPRLDLNVDEINWSKIKKTAQKSRIKIYKKVYG